MKLIVIPWCFHIDILYSKEFECIFIYIYYLLFDILMFMCNFYVDLYFNFFVVKIMLTFIGNLYIMVLLYYLKMKFVYYEAKDSFFPNSMTIYGE